MLTYLENFVPEMQSFKFNINKFSGSEIIERELRCAISDSQDIIREMCNHILNAGGKRVRPLIVNYCGNLFTYGKKEEIMQAAVAAELIHMASLVHDDIIDKSDFRRSKPSVNKLWGNHYAVLCGDYLFAKAFGLLSAPGVVCCMKYMVGAIQNMCHGEILQASERYCTDTCLDDYYRKIAKKTAVFLESCCKSGAIVAGAEAAQVDLAGQYGLNLGYAFQIIDDILDICGDSAIMGKPIGEDLLQGNLTLPVILLMEDKHYGDMVRQMVLKKDFAEENISEIKSAMEKTGIISKAYEIAGYHIDKAKLGLHKLPKSEYNDLLYGLADMLQIRAN